MQRVGTLSALIVCAASCMAQDANLRAVAADARTAAQAQVAIAMLQARQTRPTGPVSTPEQDQLNELIARDYQIEQGLRDRWRGTRYLAAFDQAFKAALRDPALRTQNPFLAAGPATRPAAPTPPRPGWSFDLLTMPLWQWFLITTVVILIGSYIIGLLIKGVLFVASPLARLGGGGYPMPTQPIPNVPGGPNKCPCGQCGATGRMQCGSCWGRGTWTDMNGQVVRCTLCVSSGKLQCTGCSGLGYINC